MTHAVKEVATEAFIIVNTLIASTSAEAALTYLQAAREVGHLHAAGEKAGVFNSDDKEKLAAVLNNMEPFLVKAISTDTTKIYVGSRLGGTQSARPSYEQITIIQLFDDWVMSFAVLTTSAVGRQPHELLDTIELKNGAGVLCGASDDDGLFKFIESCKVWGIQPGFSLKKRRRALFQKDVKNCINEHAVLTESIITAAKSSLKGEFIAQSKGKITLSSPSGKITLTTNMDGLIVRLGLGARLSIDVNLMYTARLHSAKEKYPSDYPVYMTYAHFEADDDSGEVSRLTDDFISTLRTTLSTDVQEASDKIDRKRETNAKGAVGELLESKAPWWRKLF